MWALVRVISGREAVDEDAEAYPDSSLDSMIPIVAFEEEKDEQDDDGDDDADNDYIPRDDVAFLLGVEERKPKGRESQ